MSQYVLIELFNNFVMKRFFDIVFSLIGLIIFLPIIILISIFVWFEDKSNPLYISKRVGLNGNYFKMIKIRTMVVNADKFCIDSTSSKDPRITKIGKYLRNYKLDELPQLFNILFGELSFVGPRPNVRREIDLYSNLELNLLTVKPGITDFASIVYSDESQILADKKDPDLSYNQLIRPGKSMLGLFYIENKNLFVDIFLIITTIISLFSRKTSLTLVSYLLKKLKASNKILKIASRKTPLVPSPAPGYNEFLKKR